MNNDTKIYNIDELISLLNDLTASGDDNFSHLLNVMYHNTCNDVDITNELLCDGVS